MHLALAREELADDDSGVSLRRDDRSITMGVQILY
jgi:hypothetical protein